MAVANPQFWKLQVPSDDLSDLTVLIQQAIDGDRIAEAALVDKIYDRLKAQAEAVLRQQNQNGSVRATELVHELWLKIFRNVRPRFPDHVAFFAYMARGLRSVLVDHIRERNTQARGGRFQRVPLDDLVVEFESAARVQLPDMEEALAWLKGTSDRQFQIVELRFYGGMTMKQIAEFLELSLTTVESDWTKARAKLYSRLAEKINKS